MTDKYLLLETNMMTFVSTFSDLSGKLDKTQQSLDAAQQKVAELQDILNTKESFKIATIF